MKYAVFTVMVPDWDLAETAQNLAEIGYDGVEWRVSDPANEAIWQRIPEAARQQARYWLNNRSTISPAELNERALEIKALTEKAKEIMRDDGHTLSAVQGVQFLHQLEAAGLKVEKLPTATEEGKGTGIYSDGANCFVPPEFVVLLGGDECVDDDGYPVSPVTRLSPGYILRRLSKVERDA